MKYRKIFFSMQNKEQQNVASYHYVAHRIEIVGHDRDYSNVDGDER